MGWRTRTGAGALIVAALVTAVPADAAPRSTLVITGYVESSDGPGVVRPSLAALTTVGVDGVNIAENGASVGSPDAASRTLLKQAHTAGRRAEVLVGNFSAALSDFDEPAAHRLLASRANRAAVIRTLAATAAAGWDGIHVDFESLDATDRAGLTVFTRELRAALPATKSLAMAVMASGSVGEYRAAGYDLPALASSLDRIVLMAYDQHGPGWSDAGPIGGMPWVKTVLGALLTQVPAAEVDLGVAGYGYTWPTAGSGDVLTDAEARVTARNATWDATQKEWHGTLAGGGDVWWSDRDSLQARENLARLKGLHGVAVWSLGQSDPISSS